MPLSDPQLSIARDPHTQAEVLPFTDDELDDIKDNLQDELDELDATDN